MTRAALALLLALPATPAIAAEQIARLNGAGLSPLWIVPFAGILLSIALMPVTAPAFWHHHFGKTTAFWASTLLVPLALNYGLGVTAHEVVHTLLAEYLPFMVLLFSLFIVSGGLHVRGNLHGSASQNTCLLGLGTVLASVMGTTGADFSSLEGVGSANLFVAPNFAIGAVMMMEVSQQIAKHMPEIEIIELHHDQKKDAPSGTAKRTADLIRSAGGNVHEPIHSVRLQGLVAHQEVIFGGLGETLSIRHDSISRESFMPGVLLAVRKVGGLSSSPVIGLENLL